jgi:hypothetical protein
MKATGRTIWLLEKEHSGMPRVTYMKGSLKRTRPMDKEFTRMSMEVVTKASGGMISRMATALRCGTTVPTTLEITKMEKSMVSENIDGQINRLTRASGTKIKLKAKAFTDGWMAASMTGTGRKTTCMVMEFTPGLMGAGTRAPITWTRSTGMESITGQMAAFTRDTGLTASSTAKASIHQLKENRGQAPGKKVSGSSGTTKRHESYINLFIIKLSLNVEHSEKRIASLSGLQGLQNHLPCNDSLTILPSYSGCTCSSRTERLSRRLDSKQLLWFCFR